MEGGSRIFAGRGTCVCLQMWVLFSAEVLHYCLWRICAVMLVVYCCSENASVWLEVNLGCAWERRSQCLCVQVNIVWLELRIVLSAKHVAAIVSSPSVCNVDMS